MNLDSASGKSLLRRHAELFEAIADCDPDAAEGTMQKHWTTYLRTNWLQEFAK